MSRLVKIHIYNEFITNKEETFSGSYRVRLWERGTLFQSRQNHCQVCGHLICRDQGMLKKLLLTDVGFWLVISSRTVDILFTTDKLAFFSLKRHIPYCMTRWNMFQYLFTCKTKEIILQDTACGHNSSANYNYDKTKMKYVNVYYRTEMSLHIFCFFVQHSNSPIFLTFLIISSLSQSRYGLLVALSLWQLLLLTIHFEDKHSQMRKQAFGFRSVSALKVKIGVNPLPDVRSNGSRHICSYFVKTCFRHTWNDRKLCTIEWLRLGRLVLEILFRYWTEKTRLF